MVTVFAKKRENEWLLLKSVNENFFVVGKAGRCDSIKPLNIWVESVSIVVTLKTAML
jgi:hypothetical protein